MSGIVGIFNRAGKPVQPKMLLRLVNALSHRGPDAQRTWNSDYVGFGHCMLHTTIESLNEIQPFTLGCGSLTITADARIDNRCELISQLKIDSKRGSVISDSLLILLCYEKWGSASFEKFIGDFAFAIWDDKIKTLICARDYIGVKPLFYFCSEELFVFSSEIKPLILAIPSLRRQFNETMILEFLSFNLCSQEETLFKKIYCLKPGSFFSVKYDKHRSQEYYSFHRRIIRYRDDHEYKEHFLEIFSKCVSRMLRSSTPVGIELSGGLDSSSICGIASALSKNSPTPSVVAYSQLFPGRNCDEHSFIKSVLDMWGIEGRLLRESSEYQTDYYQFINNTFCLPEPPNLALFSPLRQRASADGVRVMLSGNGGDQWFQGSNYVYLDILKSCQFPLLYRELFSTPYTSFFYNFKYMARNLLWANFPESLRRKIRRMRYNSSFPTWLQESFIGNTNFLDRLEKSDATIHSSDLGFAQVFRLIINGIENYFLGLLNQCSARYSFEYRFPFFDRELVEFALCLPEYQRIRGQQTKFIIRQAGKLTLPNLVSTRNDKAYFSFVMADLFKTQFFTKKVEQICTTRGAWIKGPKLTDHFNRSLYLLREDVNYFPSYAWEMWFAFAVELWYEICIEELCIE